MIPRPTYFERDEPDPHDTNSPSAVWVRWYLNCPNWKCPACTAVMFGRMKYCVYCKMRLNTHTPRPDTYVENTYQ